MHIAPLFVTVGRTCAGGRERRADIRLCISAAELGVRSTSGSPGGWRAARHRRVSGSTRTHTHFQLTCCHRQRVQSSSRHAGALLHKQTNTPAAPDDRQKEGRGAKQTV